MFDSKSGNSSEFKALYNEIFPVLMRISYRVTNDEDTAEELTQEAFIKLCEKAMVFPSREEAKYWLICVVKNASLNWIKRKGRERRAYERALKEFKPQIDSSEMSMIKAESLELVQDALTKLPENLRTVLVLKEYGEMNYKEIGKVLNINEGNVKVRVFRAREKLLELLKEEEPYVP